MMLAMGWASDKVMKNFVCETKEHRFVLRVMEDMRGF